MSKRQNFTELMTQAGVMQQKVLSPEEIANAEFLTLVYARQAELQEEGRNTKSARLADEWEKACQQRTHAAVVKFRKESEESFYLA